MPRRSDPEIQKYKLKSGAERYRFKTYLGINPETGKPVKVTRQGFKTFSEASNAKAKLKAQGVEAKKENKKMTLQDVWDVWFPIYQQDKRGSTILGTESKWRNYIKPEFGESIVSKISSNHVQNFAIQISRELKAYKPILNLLKRLIDYAVFRDWCDSNPFNRVKIPKKSEVESHQVKENYYSSIDEVDKLLSRIKQSSLMHYTLFSTLAALGLRNGEGLALKWKNINFNSRTIDILHTVSVNKELSLQAGKRVYSIGPTKTPSGVRTLPIPNSLYSILEDWKKESLYVKNDDLVFYRNSGSYFVPDEISNWLKRFFEKKENADLHRISPHGLRHTLATLIYQGSDKISPKDVQYLLGHSNINTALSIYTHITDKNKKNVNDSMNNLGL